MEATVTRRGQVTIPVELRRKYGLRAGVRVDVTDMKTGLLLKPVPNMKDLAGVDAGKYTHAEMVAKLDRQRRRWR